MLACQDSRMHHQPNAIHDSADGRMQLGALTCLREFLPKFVDRWTRGGPFVLSLTDLHTSNIFADDDWHITRIIDLEFACALPIQKAISVPHWLTSRGIDQLDGAYLDEYKAMYDEFVGAVQQGEERQRLVMQFGGMSCSQIQHEAWVTRRVWYYRSLTSLNAFFAMVDQRILPRFRGELHSEAEKALMNLWAEDAEGFVADKILEQERYDAQVRELFAAAAAKEKAESTAAREKAENTAAREMAGNAPAREKAENAPAREEAENTAAREPAENPAARA